MREVEQLLNAEVLDELVSILGPDKARTMLEKFQAELKGQLDRLPPIRADNGAVAATTHKLIAIAGSLGMTDLAARCATLNTVAKHSTQVIEDDTWRAFDELAACSLNALSTWRAENLG